MTIINNFNTDDESISKENFVLKSVTEHTYIVNEYEPSNTGERSKVQQMISYGLRSHVDNKFHVFDGRIEALQGSADFQIAIDAIVRNAIWIHDLPFYNEFEGFSHVITGQVNGINNLDGFELKTSEQSMDEADNESVGLYIFQRMVYDLKVNMEMEVNLFLDKHMPRNGAKGFDNPNSQLLTDRNFQIQNYDQNEKELLDIEPMIVFEPNVKKQKKSKQNKADENLLFSERIVELLEVNNEILANYDNRFEELQTQINDIKNSQPRTEDTSVKSEIAELRQMIVDLSNGKSVQEIDGSTTSIASESLIIIFEKNAFELSIGHQAKLNHAVGELKSHPRQTALITGYADKTGDPEFNAWISKARADSVKDYLVAQGIADQRLILNFLGDEESDYSNPADRKVEIQFLQNSSSIN